MWDLNLIWKYAAAASSAAAVIRYFVYPLIKTVNVAYVSLTNHIPHMTDDLKLQSEQLKEQTALLKEISKKLG
jgi:hypothetical protein